MPNAPNPFNPATTLRFRLDEAGWVRLLVFDVSGRLVRTVADGPHERGAFERTWRGKDDRGRPVAPGVYVARLEAKGTTATRKMVLVK